MQRALIVDDSKTSRLILRKMLDRVNIPVAAVESGEEALEYLKDNDPDVIFMDHMMPGMDGFATVKAIKADPARASIPIVMHTTKQGDIYVGQARALGAADILSKPASDRELMSVLNRVQKWVEQQRAEQAPVVAVDEGVGRSASVEAPTAQAADDAQSLAGGAYSAASVAPVPANHNPFFGTFRQWLLAVTWLSPLLWLLWLYVPAERELQTMRHEQLALYKALEWAVNQHESYDYGEAPLSGDRLLLLQGLLSQLDAAGFQGTVQLEGHVGEFCLSRVPLEGGGEIAMLPRPGLPLSGCSMIGTSVARAMEQSIQPSMAFLDFLTDFEVLSATSFIRVELLALGASSPKYPYPEELDGLTSGDWNAVALNNNRVHFVLLPDQ